MTVPLFSGSSDCRALMDLDPGLRDLQQQRIPQAIPVQGLLPIKEVQSIWNRRGHTWRHLIMAIRRINADDGAEAVGAYVQALEVTETTRRLYISGQAPVTTEGKVPATFKEQAETVWRNILAQLHAADMSAENIVKATTFLTDRKYRDENRDVRQVMLNGHTFALTVVLAGMFEDGWLLEIDAIAEK